MIQSRQWKLTGAIGASVMALALAAPAAAQSGTTPDDQEQANDGTIVVTAQRKLQTILDVPVSATVFSSETLEDRNYSDAKDYLLQTPNVSFQQGGRNGAREIVISIRGIADLKGGEKVLTQSAFATYIDDFSAGTLASGQANPNIYDVESVEILRGPQGVFFGRNSEGGAINIRTKKPTEDFYGRIDAGVGRFSTYSLAGVINGKVADGLFARLSVQGETTKGPLRNRHPIGGGTDADYLNIRGQLRWQPDDATTVDLQVNHTIDNSGMQPKIGSCINQGAFGLPYNLASPELLGGIGCYDAKGEFRKWVAAGPGGTRPQLGGLNVNSIRNNKDSLYQDTRDFTNNETTLVIGKAYHEFSDSVGLTFVGGYSESDQDQFLDLDRSGIRAINRLGRFRTKSYSVEGRLSSVGEDNKIDWTVGGIAYRERFAAVNQILIEQVLGPWVPGDKANENQIVNRLSGWAAFANAEWHVTDNLSLIVGGRYSYDRGSNQWSDVYAACGRRPVGTPLDTSTAVDGNGPCELTPEQALMAARGQLPVYGGFVTGGRYEQRTGRFATGAAHDFSPRLAINWKPNDDSSIYASVSKGYKPAGGQANPDSGLGGSSSFGREKLWNYEVGGNAYLLNRRLLVQGALFYMDWKDFQFTSRQTLCVLAATGAVVVVTPDLNLATCSRQLQADSVTNLPKARSKGFELSATARVTDGLTIGGSMGYLDAKYIRGQGLIGGALQPLDGLRIGNSPRWTASANVEQRFPLAGGDAAIALNWSYRGRTALGVVEQSSLTFPAAIDPVSLFNLRFTQDWGKNKLSVNVDNLFGSEYYTATEGFSFVGPQLSYSPRTWSVKWTTEF
ncbi:MAG: TonB-dependent receptor [Sphingopyxis sp.]|uniref:TonB-dependent receptor n=1 Tax=Sphingopyxis sp. TaxID=1908224 RepID=UPI003D6C700B